MVVNLSCEQQMPKLLLFQNCKQSRWNWLLAVPLPCGLCGSLIREMKCLCCYYKWLGITFSLNLNLYEDYADVLYWLKDILKQQPKKKKKNCSGRKSACCCAVNVLFLLPFVPKVIFHNTGIIHNPDDFRKKQSSQNFYDNLYYYTVHI